MNRQEFQEKLNQIVAQLRELYRNCNRDNTDENEKGVQRALWELEEILTEMEITNTQLAATSSEQPSDSLN
ncbi:MAG: hypothetical protein MUD14_00590 [Hydrococcus sp. Prado102]|jgi:hypothetical protein|nr:hypothetical protein [Hydrococcus sp. Prado102]